MTAQQFALNGLSGMNREAASRRTDGLFAAVPFDRFGQIVNLRFRLGRRLIKSGMGDVYQAHDFIQNRSCALKIVSPSLSRSPNPQQRLGHEAAVLSHLSHYNIVSGSEYNWDESGDLFIVMEQLSGRTLHQLLAKESRLPLERALRILRELGAALQYLHSLDIVHQDIKPSAIFLHEESRNRSGEIVEVVKLMSFGLARDLASGSDEDDVQPAPPWPPDYAAPETAIGEADARADQWSLAVLAHQLLTGRLPFAEQQAGQEPDLELAAELPDAASSALAKALSPSREQRYPRIMDFVHALDWAMTVRHQKSLEGSFSDLARQLRQAGSEPAPEAAPCEKEGTTRQYPNLSVPALLMASVELEDEPRPAKSARSLRRQTESRPQLWLLACIATAVTSVLAGVSLRTQPPPGRALAAMSSVAAGQESLPAVAAPAAASVPPPSLTAQPAVREKRGALVRKERLQVLAPSAPAIEKALPSSAIRPDRDPAVDAAVIESRLGDARFEYVNGNYARAIATALSIKQQAPTRAWRIIGAAACYQKDLRLIKEASDRLRPDPTAQHYLNYVCQLNGIELPSARR